MSVYIEYVIIDNYTITYLISKLTYRILRKKVKKLRLHFASIVGTIGALIYPFINSTILIVLFRIILWLILSLILFFNKEKIIYGGVVFLLVTALFGGIIIMLSMFSKDINYNYYLSLNDLPVSFLILPPLIVYKIIKLVIHKTSYRRDALLTEYDVEFGFCNNSFKLKGFLDTGNRLIDYKSGLPIVVISLKSIIYALDVKQIIDLISDNDSTMEYFTVGGKSKMTLVKPDFFRLYFSDGQNIFIDVMLGVVPDKLAGDYEVILSPAII